MSHATNNCCIYTMCRHLTVHGFKRKHITLFLFSALTIKNESMLCASGYGEFTRVKKSNNWSTNHIKRTPTEAYLVPKRTPVSLCIYSWNTFIETILLVKEFVILLSYSCDPGYSCKAAQPHTLPLFQSQHSLTKYNFPLAEWATK